MNTRVPLAALAAFAFGCASGGASDLPPPVLVYDSTDELPCEYEVIETVRGSSSRRGQGSLVEELAVYELAVYERIRADVLGRAGANIGADAVIAHEIDLVGTQRRAVGRTVTGQPAVGRAVQPPPSPPPLRQFSGEAIRFISGACRGTE